MQQARGFRPAFLPARLAAERLSALSFQEQRSGRRVFLQLDRATPKRERHGSSYPTQEDVMGYERNPGRYYRGEDERGYGVRRRDDDVERRYRDREAGYGRPRDYDEDRGFFDRAGDELRSWFGDEEAERRRRWDERVQQRGYERGDRDYRNDPYVDRSGGYASGYGGAAGFGAGYGSAGYGGESYGVGRGAGATSTYGLGAGPDHDGWGLDPNYRSWRRRQMEAFDRDYEEYRRENLNRFHDDFGSWRSNRQVQRRALGQVQEHQDVVGSDGVHIGTVDHVRDDRILLTRTDKDAGGRHHSIPCGWIAEVGDKVRINRTAAQAQAAWKDEEQGEGPHILNRAFAGTY